VEQELEIAGLAALGGWFKRKPKHPTAPPGSPCANCSTPLQGPYCHHCGQLAEDFHRSIGHLVEETFENLLHLDGRLWRTLPRLLLKPAKLTRDYLDGHRAAQIPPMRLFLVVVLLFFFAGELGKEPNINFSYRGHPVSAAETKGGGLNVSVVALPAGKESALAAWFKPRVGYASSHQREYFQALTSWGHRLAILLLPVSALMLGLLFLFQRRFFVYDHLIFAMHSLSFMGLLLSVQEGLGALGLPAAIVGWMFLAMPVHLFAHMRGVYGLGVVGTLVRMALLFAMTALVLFLGVTLMFSLSLAFMPIVAVG
jgi:hypothetical protein